MARKTVVGNLLRHVELTDDDWPKVGNVIALFDVATEVELFEGMRWYETAHNIARSLADTHWSKLRRRLTIAQAAGILAALSQRTAWSTNIVLAYTAVKEGVCPRATFALTCDKVDAILAGSDPSDVLGGPKVTSFWLCIKDPTNDQHVTIDRHAVHAAFGKVLTDAERNRVLRQTQRNDGYQIVANVYKQAARELSARDGAEILPSQVQAVVWVVWRTLITEGQRT